MICVAFIFQNFAKIPVVLFHFLLSLPGGCKKVEFFWSKGQRSNLLIELQRSNGMRSNFIVFVVWLGRSAPFAK